MTTNAPENKQRQFTIQKLNAYGQGLVEENGKRFAIPYTLPGETVLAIPGPSHKGTTWCRLQTVEVPSPSRQNPPCSHFGVCGGCDLQHMSDADQLAHKQSVVAALFSAFPNTKILPITASPKTLSYRNRVTVHSDGEHIGFYQHDTHRVVPVKNCLIASDEINAQLQNLTPKDFSGKTELELREKISGAGFSQVNSSLNSLLVAAVCESVEGPKSRRLLELYSGQGNFSFDLTNCVREVVAVEGDAQAVAKAEERRVALKNKKVRFECSSVYDAVFAFGQAYEVFDVIVCDPPREGLGRAANILPKLKARTIVCVSCEPRTLLTDIKALTHHGYELESVRPFDMFPQTRHVEVIAKLTRPS